MSDDDFGPAERGRSRRLPRLGDRRRDGGGTPARRQGRQPRRRRRGGVWRGLAVVAGVVALALVGLATGALLYASAQLDREPVDGLASGGSPTNVLLIGSDSREGLTREEQLELSTGSEGGDIADTILLLSYAGGDAALLSFPRDLYVTRCDGSQGRINASVHRGGTSCLVQTVEQLSGLPVHHTMTVRFGGFVDIVDAVGGVELCLDEPIRDARAGLDVDAGCQTLDGGDALGYVRVRAIDDDFGRMERQQEFMRALASEVADPATLLDPRTPFRLAGSGGEAITASEATGPLDLARMAWGLRGVSDAPTHTVPANPVTVGGAAVLEPAMHEAQPLFERFRTGAILGERGEDAVAPGDVAVAVRNGAGVSGLAGQVADELTGRGFDVVDVGNADPTDRTVVRHPAGQDDAAELVASELGGDPRVEEGEVGTVTVVLGADRR